MTAESTVLLLKRYYEAFNAGDVEGFFALLSDDVVHDVNQGSREKGKTAFRAFFARMSRCYRERIGDISITASSDGSRAAAEFTVQGTYLEADDGLPPANGQTYQLPGGAFFEIRGGQIIRVTNYYNLPDWLRQVSE